MKNTDGKQRFAKSLQVIGLAVVFLLVASPGGSFGQTPVKSQHSAVSPPATAIKPEEVAARASEVTNLVVTFSEKFAVSPEIEKIQQALPEINKQIDLDAAETAATAGTQPSLATLEAQRALWQRWQLQVSTWLTLLTRRAVELRRDLDRLAQMKATWTRTRDAAQAGQSPGVILQQIEAALASIEAAQLPLKAREESVLGLQADMAAKQARCDEMLAQILKARKSAVEGILRRESLPVWSPDLWGHARTTLPHRLGDIARGFQASFREYIRDPSRRLPLHMALLLVLTMATCAARRKKRQWKDSGVGVSPVVKVYDHPYSAALILVLLVATAVNSPAPARVKDVFAILALAPMIRLVRPVIDPRFTPAVFTAVILYAIDLVRQACGGAPLVEQTLLILESLAAIAVLGWLLHSGRLRYDPEQEQQGLRARWLPLLAKMLMFTLAVGCLTATLGFTRLARLISPAVLSGGVLALSLYAYVRVSNAAAVIGLRSWLLQRLRMVRNHSDRIQRWIHRLLVWTAVFFWLTRSLEYIGMLDPVLSVGGTILDLRLKRGSISISIEDILAFGLTVLAAFLLSAFIRFTLQEEVYPRRGLARGLSYAYSRLVHYVILSIGFLVGLGVLGMDLTKVTVLAGAFGVGIGFGLQNVVNNFVCGLILLFERPVHVGDIVEVGDTQGEVRRIGIRASTVRTFQGADIIVPNAQFITASVTNWTFSDELLRIDLPVGVNYGAAPQAVIELLEKTAQAHAAILETPPPKGLFTGYGDSSINFELRAWTAQFGNWAAIRSELASGHVRCGMCGGDGVPLPPARGSGSGG
ncbi:mechanosensitive ion channel domain-containing protein [Roseobacter sp.]|uniref:mechanosensitive ion channel family protein n=1 Tax=Roseobacter sp. TaxID=1907202 RepID=UPI0025D8AA9F|nr:mechanosensitive ion channel domain-containing protein [Roseobacter sp.]